MSHFSWIWDDSTEFLQPRDAYICSRFISESAKPRLLEIGVWKGGWIFCMLRNHPSAQAVGVDPYPVKEVRAKFLMAVKVRSLEKRVRLYNSCEELDSNRDEEIFDFIHIDGEHTETAVEKDLEFAMKHLTPMGVIAVDDIFHGDFPGIAYATFNFILKNPVSPFLITPGKIYICLQENYQLFSMLAKKLLDEADIEYKTEFLDEYAPVGYSQTNSIKGFKQIIVPEGQREAIKYARKLKIKNAPRSLKNRAKRLFRLFLPQIIIIVLKSFIRVTKLFK